MSQRNVKSFIIPAPPSTSVTPSASSQSSCQDAALEHVRLHLRLRAGQLRRTFRELDPQYEGCAPADELKQHVMKLLDFPASKKRSARMRNAVDRLFLLADPTRSESMPFSQLMKSIRCKSADGVANSEVGSDVLQRFQGLSIDRRIVRRLELPRTLPLLPEAGRAVAACDTSNVLGASSLESPWAVAGDEHRMDTLMAGMYLERKRDLAATLQKHADCGRLLHEQLRAALKEYDPFIHDEEVAQYFNSMASGASHRIVPHCPCRFPSRAKQGTGLPSSCVPRFNVRKPITVSVDGFVRRFAHNVLTNPALRCSATFTLQWHAQRPVPPPRRK